jgi:hypothetical protein
MLVEHRLGSSSVLSAVSTPVLDLGVNYFDQLNQEKLTRYFVKRLTRLGHRVILEPCSAAA